MSEVGSIHSEEAYALGKMLDHSAWQKGERRLPRGITGSDIDAGFNTNGLFSNITVFDNLQRTLYVEFSRHIERWPHASTGQKLVYKSLAQGGPHCSVLCRHTITPKTGKKICTRHDVVSFQPMFWDHGIVLGDVYTTNDLWQEFVFQWFDDPLRVRRQHLGKSAGVVAAKCGAPIETSLQQAVEIVKANGFFIHEPRRPDWLTRPL